MSIKKVIEAIKKYDNFLITAHINLEADAIGSQLAFYELLKKLGKKVICLDNDVVPVHYRFLPGIDNIKNNLRKGQKFDIAIVLDCPNLNRIGRVKKILEKSEKIINIDHHISNNNFGDINWVKPNSSSVGEMVYLLYKRIGVSISKEIALYIYIAILTDTGSFNYSNTSSITHEIVSELLGYGLQPQDISSFIYENKSLNEVKLLGSVISTLKSEKKGRITYIVCTKDMLKEAKATPANTENFINFARSIKGADIAIFFREDLKKKNLYNVSFRSRGKVDVNKIASFFGGGGHRNASGCVVKGTLLEVKRKVLAIAKQALA